MNVNQLKHSITDVGPYGAHIRMGPGGARDLLREIEALEWCKAGFFVMSGVCAVLCLVLGLVV